MDVNTEALPAPANTKAKAAKPRVRRIRDGQWTLSYRGVNLEVHAVIDGQDGSVAWALATLPGYNEVSGWEDRKAKVVIDHAHKTFHNDPYAAVLAEVVSQLDKAAKFARAAKRAAKAKPIAYEVSESGHEVTVEIVPGKSVGITGLVGYDRTGRSAVDKTFGLGDRVCYGSYNLYYFGEIVSIGKKTITVDCGDGRKKRLSPRDFAWYNAGDAERKHQNNAQWYD